MVIYGLAERKQDWEVFVDRDWGSTVSGRLYCRSCGRVRRDLFPRPIDVKVRQLRPGTSIGSTSLLVIGFMHRRLLRRIGEHMTGFAFGDVWDLTGEKLDNHRTLYSARPIIIRGSADSEIRQCVICGEIYCIQKGDRYVLRHDLGDRHVFQDASSTAYVDEWLASRVDFSEFKDLQLYPIPVRDYPEDGWRLPGDPDWSAMGVPCKEWQSKVLNIPSLKNADMGPWPPEGQKRGESSDQPVLPPPLPREQPMQFKYFAGSIADMGGFAGETKPCSLCGRGGPCFELDEAICPELPEDERAGKIGCFDCLRAGRFEFRHGTEIGMVTEDGLIAEQTGEPYLPEGFPESALVELRRTPRVATNQEEVWLTHCNDFMAYQGVWNPSDFYDHAPDGDGRALFLEMTDPDGQSLWDDCWYDRSRPLGYWYGTYYVFKCLHCGKLRGNWDVD